LARNPRLSLPLPLQERSSTDAAEGAAALVAGTGQIRPRMCDAAGDRLCRSPVAELTSAMAT
jgi:hypothetical protein